MEKVDFISIDHVNLSVLDLKESERWYQRVFGFEKVEQGTRNGKKWAIMRKKDSMICMVENPDRQIALDSLDQDHFHRINHFSFRIQSRAAWQETLQREKLRTYYQSPVRYPHSTSWYIYDPSGHEIEVVIWDEKGVLFS